MGSALRARASRVRLPAGWSRQVVALVIAGAVLIGVAAWAVVGDVPFVSVPRDALGCEPTAMETPRFLDPESKAVAEAVEIAEASCTGRERRFYAALGGAMAERYATAGDLAPWNRMTRYLGDDAQEAWQDGRHVRILRFAAWPVPEEPEWSESPFDDISWERTYHSLGWLHAPASLYERTGDERYAEQVRHYVLSWIRGNPVDDPPSRRSWFDGAVALRTDSIVAHLPLLIEVVEPSELREILLSLREHGRILDGYLTDERWYGHNHNLFHALSLHNLAASVPELRRADTWRGNARERIGTLLAEMVGEDGVSTEQAANYHYTAIGWFATAQRYFSDHGLPLDEEAGRLLTEMTRFGALLPTPQGELPAIGDTRFGAHTPWEPIEGLDEQGLAHREAAYVLSRGARGSRPEDLVAFPAAGYAIMRPSYGEVGDWEDDLHVVADMGSYRRVHGHRDAMNVLLSAHGASLLVDSGGPYAYGVDRRSDYIHAAAHNTVVVDGDDHPEHGTVSLDEAADAEAYSLVEGSFAPADDVRHTRTVVLLKPDLVVVVDRLRSTTGPRGYELLWHLNPDATLSESPTGLTATVADASLGVTVATSEQNVRRIRAAEPASPVGWVTPGRRRESEAPVLSVSQDARDAWFVTALRPTAAAAAAEPVLSVESRGDGLTIGVDGGRGTWELRLDPDGPPIVSAPQ